MPLTEKGEKTLSAMEKEYGAKKGESVFYASKNKGTISGVDAAELKERMDATRALCDGLGARMDEWSDEARKKAAEARKKGGGSNPAGSYKKMSSQELERSGMMNGKHGENRAHNITMLKNRGYSAEEIKTWISSYDKHTKK